MSDNVQFERLNFMPIEVDHLNMALNALSKCLFEIELSQRTFVSIHIPFICAIVVHILNQILL